MYKSRLSLLLSSILLAQASIPIYLPSETYEDQELSSRNLVLPEMEQFTLGSKLFHEKDKKVAAWKAFQTFLFTYPDSRLAPDAQFMLAESIFSQALEELINGTAPDEYAWEKQQ